MKRYFFLLTTLLVGFASCSNSDDDEVYPNLVTELCMAHADAQGTLSRIVTDSGGDYHITNEVTGLNAYQKIRALIGYVTEGNGQAKVYTAQEVPLLPDASKNTARYQDPTGVESVWKGGGFINFHLLPKTKGAKQGWAFLRDSTTTNALGGQTHHLSLYHRQGNDPTSYSRELYLSLPIDSVATTLTAADSITFVVHTFQGPKSWHFGNF